MNILHKLNRIYNHIYAEFWGYFWHPCPICGENFGGHEYNENITLLRTPANGRCICKKKSCERLARENNNIIMEKYNDNKI